MRLPLRLLALLLPLAGLAGAWIWTHARARQGAEWDVPVSARGPRASLRGRYVAYRYDWGLPEEANAAAPGALCLEGTPPVLASVRVSDRADRTCLHKVLAVPDGSRHEGIAGGIVYVPQDQVPTIRRRLADPRLQPVVRVRLNPAGAITPLAITFRPLLPGPSPAPSSSGATGIER